ncbi:hypothetical protein DSM112329_03070 [Paraconexibacter sp. AEG42_29]|uniref:Uncharacterized protein n=1 Tax=Paraconexibacter sp. AEG42_29 TaxID=2997339 RepID=A0AAU7AX50_9ACTN
MSEPTLQLSAAPVALFDDGLTGTRLRGAGEQPDAVWRAKVHDDEGRVWRAIADSPGALSRAWVPAKSSTGELAAHASLRPVAVEVRVELPDGRALARTVTRSFVGDGVRVRRWRDDLAASLYLPAGEGPFPAAVLDATEGAEAVAVGALAGALLASRGVLSLVVAPPARYAPGAGRAALALAVERVAALPAAADAGGRVPVAAIPPATTDAGTLEAGTFVPVPPGVGVRGAGAGPEAAAARAAAWDALLAALGATPRAA